MGGEGTFAGTRGNDEVAPIRAIRAVAPERRGRLLHVQVHRPEGIHAPGHEDGRVLIGEGHRGFRPQLVRVRIRVIRHEAAGGLPVEPLADEARVAAGTYETQEQGDGGITLLSTGEGVSEPRLVASLIEALDAGLAQVNEDLTAETRVRLRVGFDAGVVRPPSSKRSVGPLLSDALKTDPGLW